MKKIAALISGLAIIGMFLVSGCEQKQGGQAPEKSAPTSSPSTAPSGTAEGGK